MTDEPNSSAAHQDADQRAVAGMLAVTGVYRNYTNWYNNASFLLPLAAATLMGIADAVLRSRELAGFAGFLLAVTLAMLPLVLATWRQTATAVVLTRDAITSLHRGRVLKRLAWSEVKAIGRRETQGNVRWEIASSGSERILIDGEVEDLPALIECARALAGLPPDNGRSNSR